MSGSSGTPSCCAAPGRESAGGFRRVSTRTARLEMVHKVGPSPKDTSREAQGDALLRNRAESQELLELRDRKLSQLKLEPVMRLGYVLSNAGSAHQGVRGQGLDEERNLGWGGWGCRRLGRVSDKRP